MNGPIALHPDRKVTTSIPAVPGSPLTIQAILYSTATAAAGDGLQRVPYDLSGLFVQFEMTERGRRERGTSRLATITDADEGEVEIELGGYETAQAGSYAGRFIVLAGDGVTVLARYPADDGLPIELGGRSHADKMSLLNRAITAALAAIDSAAEALASQIAAAASAAAAAASEAVAAGYAAALGLANTAFVDVALSSIAALEASAGSANAIRTVRGERGGRFYYFADFASAQGGMPAGLGEMTEAQARDVGIVFDSVPTGGIWVRAWDGREIRPEWGDDAGDALHAALAVVLESNTMREIPLPPSATTDDTLHIRRAAHAQASAGLVGTGMAFWGEPASEISGSLIDMGGLTPDRPGIAIQSGRYVRLHNFGLSGPLDAYVAAWVGDVISHKMSDYVADMGGASVSRESPLAGIVIDPYMGTAPGDPYPEAGFYGAVGGSASTEIDRVMVRGFGIGLLLHPRNDAATDANSSETEVRMDSFCNAIGVSIGSTQARSAIMKDLCNISYGFVALTGIRHGRRLGPLPRVRSLNTFAVYRLFETVASWGVVDVEGVHAELLGEIGLFGLGIVGRPMPGTIRGCHFDYYISNGSGSSISATPFYALMPIAWEGNAHIRTISDNGPAACTYNYAGPVAQSFRGDSFLFADNEAIVLFVSAASREIKMEGCNCSSGTESKLVNTHSSRNFPGAGSRRMYVAPWVKTLHNLNDGVTYEVEFPRPGHIQGVSNANQVDAWDWGTATFHVTSADGRRYFVGDRILLPCIIDTDPDNPWASGNWELLPAARITAYDTGTRVATFERLFHPDALDEAQTPTHIQYAVRQFAIDPAVTADFTATSPIVDLNLPSGVVSNYFAVGDEVTTADGTALPNTFTRVLSIDDGAVQMTLTHNAATTVAAQPIFNAKLTAL